MSEYFKIKSEVKDKKKIIKELGNLIDEDNEKIEGYKEMKYRILDKQERFTFKKCGQIEFLHRYYTVSNINLILQKLYFKDLTPLIYYLWSRQKKENPYFTLFVGSTFEYRNNWLNQDYTFINKIVTPPNILFKLDGYDTTRVFKTIDDFKTKIFNQYFTIRNPKLSLLQNFFIYFHIWNGENKIKFIPSVFDELEKIKKKKTITIFRIYTKRKNISAKKRFCIF